MSWKSPFFVAHVSPELFSKTDTLFDKFLARTSHRTGCYLFSGMINSPQTAVIPDEDSLFFLEHQEKSVGVARLDGTQRKRLIVHNSANRLRGIAVDPVAR